MAARAVQLEARARAEKTQASAPAAETIEPEPASPSDDGMASTSSDKSEKNDFAGGYGPQWSQQPQSWKSTGRQIDLQA